MAKPCKKCGEHIPNRVFIEGKECLLFSRRFCLKCSPYKKHNTVDLTKDRATNCVCRDCGKHYHYDRSKGHGKDICSSCRVTFSKRKRKQFWVNKKGGKCIVCGYNKTDKVLCFHHIDETKKTISLSVNNLHPKHNLEKEMENCVVLCMNCHAEVHAGLIDLEKYI